MDIRQAEVAALERERQLRVVDAEQVQHRGVQVVDVHVERQPARCKPIVVTADAVAIEDGAFGEG